MYGDNWDAHQSLFKLVIGNRWLVKCRSDSNNDVYEVQCGQYDPVRYSSKLDAIFRVLYHEILLFG
jgi:hypothetical protein